MAAPRPRVRAVARLPQAAAPVDRLGADLGPLSVRGAVWCGAAAHLEPAIPAGMGPSSRSTRGRSDPTIAAMARAHARPAAFLRLWLAALFVAAGLTIVGPAANPAPVEAATAGTVEATILGWINAERTKRGLVPLRLHSGLVDLAGDRAATMASTGVFKHPSCVKCLFDSRGIQYWSGTEVISWSGYELSENPANSLYSAWRNSSLHWGILMSSKYNYIGIGVADRSSTNGTYAAGLLTESRDRTKPWAKMVRGSKSGSSVTWTWDGADTKLQTHTSGLQHFVVQYRVDSGIWTTLRTTTAKSLTLSDRERGHCYSLRIRSRDNRDYLSDYSGTIRVCV